MARPREPRGLPQTRRQALAEALRAGPATARDLSKAVGIPEREVPDHLVHLAKTLRAHGERLVTLPARCLDCGFVHARRERPARPSHCAGCRGTRLTLPEFSIAAADERRAAKRDGGRAEG